eukprot:CAMPEP_0206376230 /NCGR_PEP_ID=MMETSP0294-20121207/9359_1 /ASSEMBLY_ACC=CAM_ASM_000327 /TAXON_ID=39354 /ORGANISM="Heterosigma akashiwo, Strain CCMP2393" /LENGTH=47 /DNA_ID= /DNA_START= /DNA_END= /DNA_ORIENTATION=
MILSWPATSSSLLLPSALTTAAPGGARALHRLAVPLGRALPHGVQQH